MATTEKYFINKDIKVLCMTAASFPEGVLSAHRKLHSMFPSEENRMFYGISRPNDKGEIIYKAAAEELQKGEAEKLGLETFVIKKGEYISELLKDWCKDEKMVEKTFKKLLADPRIDKNGYCLEMYLNEKDMRCMVPLHSSTHSNTNLKLMPLFF